MDTHELIVFALIFGALIFVVTFINDDDDGGMFS